MQRTMLRPSRTAAVIARPRPPTSSILTRSSSRGCRVNAARSNELPEESIIREAIEGGFRANEAARLAMGCILATHRPTIVDTNPADIQPSADPINAALFLGPQALLGAISSLPSDVEKAQQEAQELSDRLSMLAQDPRPVEEKAVDAIADLDKILSEFVAKGQENYSAAGLPKRTESAQRKARDRAAAERKAAGAARATSAVTNGAPSTSESESLDVVRLQQEVAEFTSLYTKLQGLKRATKDYDLALESEKKMQLTVVKEAADSLQRSLEEFGAMEREESVSGLPFADVIVEGEETLRGSPKV